MTDARVLVVDDNRNVLTALELLLSREFSGVKCINKPGQIQSELQSASYSAVLLDMNYSAGQNSGNEGLFWLRELQKSDPDLSVVMITAFGDIELAVTALKEGAVDFCAETLGQPEIAGHPAYGCSIMQIPQGS
jgi:DNA-binding NtrC family response regulator